MNPMVIIGKIIKNTYRDSIAMMRAANELSQSAGVHVLEVLIGTPTNIENLRSRKLFVPQLSSATVNDIVIVVQADNNEIAQNTIVNTEERLLHNQAVGGSISQSYNSIDVAFRMNRLSNLVLLSIPGLFVKNEALTAINKGLNLMIFSDNVSLEDEVEIKTAAQSRGLLVMGPDCGTAILGGYGLGFANKVSRGRIGIVGASGTGIQEVSCLAHRAGLGISQGIGTGSNDIKQEVGGITFLRGIDILENDPQSEVLVLVSKPPAPTVEEKILSRISQCGKPVVICFLGSGNQAIRQAGATPADTLEEAAFAALKLMGIPPFYQDEFEGLLSSEADKFKVGQKYIRGIFSGGTLAIESAILLQRASLEAPTNLNFGQLPLLVDPHRSTGHACVDLGEDVFTRGKPHPMLDPLMRRNRILQEAQDPETALLLLDFVLGYGVHPDPVNEILETLRQAQQTAQDAGRHLTIAASVCGTEEDPQIRSRQVEMLKQNGCLVFESNSQATRFAAALAQRLAGQENLS